MSIEVLSNQSMAVYPIIADGPLLKVQYDVVDMMPYTFGSADFGNYLTNRNDVAVVCQVTSGDFLYYLAQAISHFVSARLGKIPENIQRPQFYAQAMSNTAYRDLQIVRAYFRSFSDPASAAYMHEEALFQIAQYSNYISRPLPVYIDSTDIGEIKRAEQVRAERLIEPTERERITQGKRPGRSEPFANIETLVATLNRYYLNQFKVSDNRNEIERYRVAMLKILKERAITDNNFNTIDELVDLEGKLDALQLIVKIDDENTREKAFIHFANLMLKIGDLYECQMALIHPACPPRKARDEVLETLYLRYQRDGKPYNAKGVLGHIQDGSIISKYEKAGPSTE
ncbi:MAG: hypothetical protein P0S94_03765 [Simkaniaceae bacterium]|nr:hypothetical protein [Simkaniaceae bacterium]